MATELVVEDTSTLFLITGVSHCLHFYAFDCDLKSLSGVIFYHCLSVSYVENS